MGESGDDPSEAKLEAKEKEKKGVLFLSSSCPCAHQHQHPACSQHGHSARSEFEPRVYQSQLVFELAVGDR